MDIVLAFRHLKGSSSFCTGSSKKYTDHVECLEDYAECLHIPIKFRDNPVNPTYKECQYKLCKYKVCKYKEYKSYFLYNYKVYTDILYTDILYTDILYMLYSLYGIFFLLTFLYLQKKLVEIEITINICWLRLWDAY